MAKERKPYGYWNSYENCCEEAKKYSTKKDFSNGSHAAYCRSVSNGWISSFNWLKSKALSKLNGDEKYIVYVVEFPNNNAAYVGITRLDRGETRKKEHEGRDKSSAVVKFSREHNMPKQVHKILKSGLSCEDAGDYEHYYEDLYKKNGWKVLNTAPTGRGISSLGGGYIKWDIDSCKKYIENNGIHTRGELEANNSGAYERARKMGWLDELFGVTEIKPHGYWNRETCYDAAQKCSSRVEFQRKYVQAYRLARINKWLDDYSWFISSHDLYSASAKKGQENRKRPINQYDKEGNLIASWDSAMDAARTLGIGQGNIASCLIGKAKSAYGFIWKYAS